MSLITDTNYTDADAFYAELTGLHRELSPEQSERVNARLILLLSNHIGENSVLSEAMTIAGQLQDNTGAKQ